MKVKIRWFQSNAVREKICYLDKGNSTVYFAAKRGKDTKRLTLDDFHKQRFVYFVDGATNFLVRFDDLISIDFVE